MVWGEEEKGGGKGEEGGRGGEGVKEGKLEGEIQYPQTGSVADTIQIPNDSQCKGSVTIIMVDC